MGVADCEEIGSMLLALSSSSTPSISMSSLTDSSKTTSREATPDKSDEDEFGVTITSGDKQHHIATSKLTELINQLEKDREYRNNPEVSDNDLWRQTEDLTEEKPKLRK